MRGNNSFHTSLQLFGLDFMIDESYNVWLIEVNTNPCLECSGSLLSRLIPTLVENVFRVAVDPIFPPPNYPKNKKHMIPDNVFENNKFELFFDELQEGEALRNLLQDKKSKHQYLLYAGGEIHL